MILHIINAQKYKGSYRYRGMRRKMVPLFLTSQEQYIPWLSRISIRGSRVVDVIRIHPIHPNIMIDGVVNMTSRPVEVVRKLVRENPSITFRATMILADTDFVMRDDVFEQTRRLLTWRDVGEEYLVHADDRVLDFVRENITDHDMDMDVFCDTRSVLDCHRWPTGYDSVLGLSAIRSITHQWSEKRKRVDVPQTYKHRIPRTLFGPYNPCEIDLYPRIYLYTKTIVGTTVISVDTLLQHTHLTCVRKYKTMNGIGK
jgi:hypothetical protein